MHVDLRLFAHQAWRRRAPPDRARPHLRHGSFGEALTFLFKQWPLRHSLLHAIHSTRSMAPSNGSSPQVIETSDTNISFDWNGDPLTRHPWAKYLERRVYKHDARFRSHVQQGHHMAGHRTITQSVEHSQNMYHHNVRRSSWADPACLGNWQYAGSAPTADVIPAEEMGNYTASRHDCESIDRALIDFILSTVTCETEREDLEEECGGDARTLILNIQNYRPPEEVCTWALKRRNQIISSGIEVAQVKGFNDFRMWYCLYNEQCSVPDPDAVSSSVYITALRNLGEFLSGKLDYELLRSQAGHGCGSPTPTMVIKAIKQVLTRHGANVSTGTALQMGSGHDPRRTPPAGGAGAPATPRIWKADSDELCELCKSNPFDNGNGPRRHLRKHCREFKPKPPGERKGKKGSGKAAGGTADSDSDDDDCSDCDDDDEDAAHAFYASDGAVAVHGAGESSEAVEVKVNEMLLGGQSGTVTLSESLSRVGSAKVATSANETAAAAAAVAPLAPPPPPTALAPPPPIRAPATPSLAAAVAAAPSAPATPSYQEIRAAVAALSPDSPIKLVRDPEAAVKLGVKTNVGGTSHRRTRDIVDDMRSRVGLGPCDPPLGLPVKPADAPPSVGLPVLPAADAAAAAQLAPSLPPDALKRAPPPPPPPPPLPPALRWTASVGVEVTSAVRREADGMGRLLHIFSIVNPNTLESVECSHGAEPQLVPAAPPRSHFLGNDDGDLLYWLTPTGAIVRTAPTSLHDDVKVVPARSISICPTSFCFAAASLSVLVLSLFAGVVIGQSNTASAGLSLIGYARAPHDPGEFFSRTGFRGGTSFSLVLPILVMCMFIPTLIPAFLKLTLVGSLRCRLRPAKPPGLGFARWFGCIKPPSGHPPSPRESRLLDRDRWKSTFSSRREFAWGNLVSAARCYSPPWLLLVLLLEWSVLALMDLGALFINCRTTSAGDAHGPDGRGRWRPSEFQRWTTRRAWCSLLFRLQQIRRNVRRGFSLVIPAINTLLVAAVLSIETVAHNLRPHHWRCLWRLCADVVRRGWCASLDLGWARRICFSVLLRCAPLRFSLFLIRCAFAISSWRLAVLRVVRYLLSRRARHDLSHLMRTARLALVLSFGFLRSAWSRPRRGAVHVAPLPRARVHSAAAVTLAAKATASAPGAPAVGETAQPALPRRVGFALRNSSLRAPKRKVGDHQARTPWLSSHSIRRWIELVIDSGCTWHVHHTVEDLVNVKPCHDTVIDAQGNSVECKWIVIWTSWSWTTAIGSTASLSAA